MTRHKQLLRLIARNPGITFPEIRSTLALSTGNASKLVAELVAQELVARYGPRRKYQFFLTTEGHKRNGSAGPMAQSSIFHLASPAE